MKTVPSDTPIPSERLLKALVTKLRANPNLFTSRLTLAHIRILIKENRCVFLFDEEMVYGFTAYWPTENREYEGHFEIGPIWRDESKKGNALAGYLFREILSKVAESHRTLYLITKAEVIASIATSHGWAKVDSWQNSFWRQIYEPLDGDRTPHESAMLYFVTL